MQEIDTHAFFPQETAHKAGRYASPLLLGYRLYPSPGRDCKTSESQPHRLEESFGEGERTLDRTEQADRSLEHERERPSECSGDRCISGRSIRRSGRGI